MWICPICKKKFKRANQFHSHTAVPVARQFRDKPELKAVYDYLVGKLATVGDFSVNPTKNAIQFKNKSIFFALSVKKGHLKLEFYSDRDLTDDRFIKKLQVSRNRIVHCLKVTGKGDIDSKLIGWIKASYNLIHQKPRYS